MTDAEKIRNFCIIHDDFVVANNTPWRPKTPPPPPLRCPTFNNCKEPPHHASSEKKNRSNRRKRRQQPFQSGCPLVHLQEGITYPQKFPTASNEVYIQERLDRARELAGLAFEGIRNQTAYSQKLPSEQTVNVPLTKQFEKMKERLGNLKASEVVEGAREKLRGARENGRLAALRIGAVVEEIEERMGRDNKYQQELDRNEINKKTIMDNAGHASHLRHANQQPREQTQTEKAVQEVDKEAKRRVVELLTNSAPEKVPNRTTITLHETKVDRRPRGSYRIEECEQHDKCKRPRPKNLLPAKKPTAYYTHEQYVQYQKKVSKPRNLPPSKTGGR